MSRIVVIGSANADLMLAMPTLPLRGETVRGHDFIVAPGGKGANQAVAAARLGGDVSFVGCVGDDSYGVRLRAALSENGVDATCLSVKPNVATGIAMVLTEASGENSIAIAAGANDWLLPEDIDAVTHLIAAASLVLCQFESPDATVARVLALAGSCGTPVLLNPAPARAITDAELNGVRFLVPNRNELAQLTGMRTDTLDDVDAAAADLRRRGVEVVIVTLGRDGAFRSDSRGTLVMPAPIVQAIDTTGAGDTFVGGFAAEWCRTGDVDAAIAFAQRAAALSVTGRGAQASMPRLADLK